MRKRQEIQTLLRPIAGEDETISVPGLTFQTFLIIEAPIPSSSPGPVHTFEAYDFGGFFEDWLAAGESVVDVVGASFVEPPRHPRHDQTLPRTTLLQSWEG